MRARDAENLIADFLTKRSNNLDSKIKIDQSDLLGLQRSKPIYLSKIREKEEKIRKRRYLLYRRILSGLIYPVIVIKNFFKYK